MTSCFAMHKNGTFFWFCREFVCAFKPFGRAVILNFPAFTVKFTEFTAVLVSSCCQRRSVIAMKSGHGPNQYYR